MSELPFPDSGSWWNFATTNFQNVSIYVTGGYRSETDSKRSVAVLDIAEERWSEGPTLNEERENHSSCYLNQQVYVFGGDCNSGSIESLRIGLEEAAW